MCVCVCVCGGVTPTCGFELSILSPDSDLKR